MPQNNDDIFSLRNLAMERDQARENLQDNGAETKERLKPSNLIAEAKLKAADSVKKAGQSAINGMRQNPGITATVAATATLIAMRRPIAKLVAKQKTAETDKIED
ncbi:hypothetical protein [Parasphingorhabdus sp.]|uniref:hypothetical protein n=1 Tax=Parasphingorhabdus sp. TaxID=2709688 RepID=UPI003266315B